MLERDLVRLYPRLYHMAQDGSWPSIRLRGLLSAQGLIKLFEVEEPRRSQLLHGRRPESVRIAHPIHGSAVVRDQKPLSEKKLAACLTDMTVPEWLNLLNSRVFFWLQEQRLNRLLTARAYRDSFHTILVLDTGRLVAAHRDRITLSPINSGSTAWRAQPRGSATFATIAGYPHPPRQRALASASDIAELAVEGGIDAIDGLVLCVERRRGAECSEILYAT